MGDQIDHIAGGERSPVQASELRIRIGRRRAVIEPAVESTLDRDVPASALDRRGVGRDLGLGRQRRADRLPGRARGLPVSGRAPLDNR